MIPTDIIELLEKALEEKIGKFEIQQDDGKGSGQSYLGDMLFLTLKNKNEKLNVVVKQASSTVSENTKEFMSSSYLNEIYFYTKLVPNYIEFQKSFPKSQRFDNIPKCLAASTEKGNEKLVLENLLVDNYEMYPRNIPVTDEMYQEIFKVYGKYHGLSLAFKKYQPEKFSELASCFSSHFKKFLDHGILKKAIIVTCCEVQKHLEAIGEKELGRKFEKYVLNGPKLFSDCLLYRSPFSVIIHGDSWISNLMFKFNKSKKIEDIKMIDFQMVICGSPVLDLTYILYSRASAPTLDKLDHFLAIYYNSVKNNLEQYDCDIGELFSFEDLKQEWKEHHAFGFLMSLVISFDGSIENEVPNIPDMLDKYNDEYYIKDSEVSKKFATDLIRHMYDNDFL
ncbi:uncharacterized protein LOC130895665 isoform X1 [Diorhabda carinulata]|uniref:uncharacterized protein LOC130895665 isoform X1 n=2 Tax=Diorhabda carinulata TaxID=1163345 RepID=UPI0025A2F84D|nr:uncharacterized protein LOC130895665 isoform X1 [Diorhabda carinulata]